MMISTSGPTAVRMEGRTSMVAGLVSSCRAPWLDTHLVVNPVSTALTASSGRHTPLTAEGAFHSPSSHSASRQSNSGAIWL